MALTADTVFEILLWLPVLSLLRFKSVCKSWYALIQSPLFIDQHHLRRLMDTNLLVLDHTPPPQFCQLQAHNLEFSKQIDLPNFFQGHVVSFCQVITCNGLVCVSYLPRITDSLGFLLWNPAIKQFRDLPQPPLPCEALQYFDAMGLGFGFDSTTNDYTVVFFIPELDLDGLVHTARVYKYSLIADSWTAKLAAMPNNILITTSNPMTQVTSGTYSWFGSATYNESPHYLLSFHFGKEVFEAMPLPKTCAKYPHFGILKGCISCINGFNPTSPSDTWKQIEIWVLKEYGIAESWTKLYTLRPFTNIRCPCPIGFSKNGEYLFLFESPRDQRLCLYDIVTHEIKKLLNNSSHFLWTALYKESLVSLKGGICYL